MSERWKTPRQGNHNNPVALLRLYWSILCLFMRVINNIITSLPIMLLKQHAAAGFLTFLKIAIMEMFCWFCCSAASSLLSAEQDTQSEKKAPPICLQTDFKYETLKDKESDSMHTSVHEIHTVLLVQLLFGRLVLIKLEKLLKTQTIQNGTTWNTRVKIKTPNVKNTTLLKIKWL